MALPPINTSDDSFIREVDEEYRRDQLSKLWARYGRWILVGVGLFLVALAVFLYWREERQQAAARLGDELVAAFAKIEAGNVEAAQPVLARAAAAPHDGYAAVGKLAQAALAARAADTQRAATLYGQVAADEKLAQPFRDLATLRQIMLQYDSLAPAQLVARLRPLAQEGSPWFGSAGELLAVAYLRDGKPQMAGPLFVALAKNAAVPPTIRARAGQMASSLGLNPLPPAPTGPATASQAQPATQKVDP